ncbi:TPA: hypothetical protein HA318_03070 [Candidatus Micrarchaeota archaeon]|nr:hypothetical protein [Candidatus Micrarchaeota archaeon]
MVSIVRLSVLAFFVLVFAVQLSAAVAPLDVTPPSPPELVYMTRFVPSNEIRLGWLAGYDNAGGSGVCSYNVYLNESFIAQVDGRGNVSYLFTSAVKGDIYVFYVTSVDCVGLESGPSNTDSSYVFDRPTAPYLHFMQASRSFNDVWLNWTGVTDFPGITGYNIYAYNASFLSLPANYHEYYLLASVPVNQTNYTDNATRVYGDWYVYFVRAFNATGDEGRLSNTVFTDYDTLPPISGISFVTPPSLQGSGGWFRSDVLVNITSFDEVSGVNKVRYAVDGVKNVSYNRSGYKSGISNLVSVPGVEGIHLVEFQARDRARNWEAVQNLSVPVDWTAPSAPVLSGVSPSTNGLVELSWNASVDALSGIGYYAVYCDAINADVGAEYSANTTALQYSFAVSNPGYYYCRVQAFDIAGNSVYSNEISVRVDAVGSPTPTPTPTPVPPLAPPAPFYSNGGGASYPIPQPAAATPEPTAEPTATPAPEAGESSSPAASSVTPTPEPTATPTPYPTLNPDDFAGPGVAPSSATGFFTLSNNWFLGLLIILVCLAAVGLYYAYGKNPKKKE